MTACILIAGMPASGKSTFARMLTGALNVPCFSKDAIKESLYDTLGFRSRAEKVRLGEAAYRVQLDLAAPLLRAGLTVALENNFEDVSIPPLTEMLNRCGCTPVTVLLDGDPAVIWQRFILRDQSPGRHRGHVVNTEYPERTPAPYVPMTQEAFLEMVQRRGFRRFDAGGPRRVVDATDPGAVDWSNVLDWVRAQLLCNQGERHV